MCSGTDANNETDFETIVSKLMKLDGDSSMLISLYNILYLFLYRDAISMV